MSTASGSPPGSVTRRELLRGAQALGIATLAPGALSGCGSDAEPGPENLFQHGVASGDPVEDGVILWTRVSPTRTELLEVEWEVAADPSFDSILASGATLTSVDRDLTVKVDVRGLPPGQTFYYRFRAQERTSPIGRTRTAPAGSVGRARFGVASCSSFAQGYFHAYRALAARTDLDAVLHLGDYIYESGPGQFGDDRAIEPAREATTLVDYRTRHAQYKRDPDLQEVHRQHPFICVWDDHESANNAWKDGAINHQPETEGALGRPEGCRPAGLRGVDADPRAGGQWPHLAEAGLGRPGGPGPARHTHVGPHHQQRGDRGRAARREPRGEPAGG